MTQSMGVGADGRIDWGSVGGKFGLGGVKDTSDEVQTDTINKTKRDTYKEK